MNNSKIKQTFNLKEINHTHLNEKYLHNKKKKLKYLLTLKLGVENILTLCLNTPL